MTRWFIDTPASRRFPVYTRSNANDVLPNPVSPMGATVTFVPGVCEGFRTGFVHNRATTMEELTFEGLNPMTGVFAGYFYVNASVVRVFGVRSGAGAAAIDAAFFGSRPDTPPYVPHPDDESEEATARIGEQVGWVLSTTEFPHLDESKRMADALRVQRPDLTTLTDAQLVDRVRQMIPLLVEFFDDHVITSSNTAIGPTILGQLVPDLMMRLVSGSGDVDSAAPSHAMWALSRLPKDSPEYAAGFEQFLRDFGARGPDEWDVIADVWETKPSLPTGLIDAMRKADDSASPAARLAAVIADRKAADAEAHARLDGNEEALGMLHAAQGSALRFLAWRERSKTNCVKAVNEQRVALLELGRRHAATGALHDAKQVFMLTNEELDAFVADPSAWRATLDEREATWRHLWSLEPWYFVEGGKPVPEIEDLAPKVSEATTVGSGEVLVGSPGCPGVARGRARVLLSSDEADTMEFGDILVAPNTDPSWTPLFVPAAGVVVDVGAMNSHAIIVSRELGIPCAVMVVDATKRIPDGATIEVNGDTGVVTVIALPSGEADS
jgi:pyruvate,water dikinase